MNLDGRLRTTPHSFEDRGPGVRNRPSGSIPVQIQIPPNPRSSTGVRVHLPNRLSSWLSDHVSGGTQPLALRFENGELRPVSGRYSNSTVRRGTGRQREFGTVPPPSRSMRLAPAVARSHLRAAFDPRWTLGPTIRTRPTYSTGTLLLTRGMRRTPWASSTDRHPGLRWIRRPPDAIPGMAPTNSQPDVADSGRSR